MGQTTFEAAQIDSIVELVNDLYDGVRVIVVKKKFNQPEKAVCCMLYRKMGKNCLSII